MRDPLGRVGRNGADRPGSVAKGAERPGERFVATKRWTRIRGYEERTAAVRSRTAAADELEAAQVEAARKAGVTWIEIGACYGLTKQGAQQRFRAVRNQAKAVTAEPGTKKTEPTA